MAIITTTVEITSNSNVLINSPILFSSSGIDAGLIRTMFVLDNKPLTNHGRKFDENLSFIYVENINWNNKKFRYYKRSASAGRKTFNLNWTMVPGSRENTVDQRYGRDFMRSISEDPDVHILKIINMDESGTTAYTETQFNVFIRSYSETLIRRDIDNNVYYYDCSMTLEEA